MHRGARGEDVGPRLSKVAGTGWRKREDQTRVVSERKFERTNEVVTRRVGARAGAYGEQARQHEDWPRRMIAKQSLCIPGGHARWGQKRRNTAGSKFEPI